MKQSQNIIIVRANEGMFLNIFNSYAALHKYFQELCCNYETTVITTLTVSICVVLFLYSSPYVIHLCVKIGSYKFQHRKLGFNLSKKTIFMTTYLLIFHINISWKKVRSIFTTRIFSIDSRTYNYKLCYIELFPTNTKHFQLALLFQLSWSSIDIWFPQFMQIEGDYDSCTLCRIMYWKYYI